MGKKTKKAHAHIAKSKQKEKFKISWLHRLPIFFFFFVSGLAGLVMEVVWGRMLSVVFGNTIYAASTVLTAFMLGLALGSYWFGKIADRYKSPLALYGYLEISIGVYAFLFPLIASSLLPIYRFLFQNFESNYFILHSARFLLSLLFIVPPATLMGGTLPIVSRYMGIQQQQHSRVVGYLYAINTTGAVAGCFLAGFFLLELLGVRGTLYAAGTVAFSIGLLAVVFSRSTLDLNQIERSLKNTDTHKKRNPRKMIF